MKLYATPWGDYNTLGIDFALEEGANPTDAFWMGSQFADEDWRNKHLGQPDVKRTGLNTNVNLNEFLRSDGIAKMKEKEKQVEMAEAKSAVKRTMGAFFGTESDEEDKARDIKKANTKQAELDAMGTMKFLAQSLKPTPTPAAQPASRFGDAKNRKPGTARTVTWSPSRPGLVSREEMAATWEAKKDDSKNHD